MDKTFFARNIGVYYIAYWMIVAIIQFALLFAVYNLSFVVSIVDSIISIGLFSILGIGLWFMVRFSGKQIKGFIKNLIYHILGCAISVTLWFVISTSILENLFSDNGVYLSFLDISSVVRILIGVLIYFLLISLDFLILSFEEMNTQADHEAALSAMLRDAELNMLRSQIKPHFLFNSLNSISALTISNPEAAQSMIIKLSEFMRHSLQLGSEAMNTLLDELYHLKLYLDIEKVRFPDRLLVEINNSDKCNELLMPAMILQPLLENAVKYGVNTLLVPCKVTIEIQCNENNLQITISNNFDPEVMPRKGTGTGISNVRMRLNAIYGRTDLLKTSIDNQVFTVNLLIPSSNKINKD